MATHFRWYGSNTTVTVPFNAVYTYPSQGMFINGYGEVRRGSCFLDGSPTPSFPHGYRV